jgi:hypothetical protein
MTSAKLMEYRITRHLVQRRWQQAERADTGGLSSAMPASVQSWADRLIAVLALTACLLVVGSYIEELLWVVLAAATAFTLRG